ncbi:MAG: hypothetical protein ACYC6Y_27580, partial [Thermoguttaceae bacterium]
LRRRIGGEILRAPHEMAFPIARRLVYRTAVATRRSPGPAKLDLLPRSTTSKKMASHWRPIFP